MSRTINRSPTRLTFAFSRPRMASVNDLISSREVKFNTTYDSVFSLLQAHCLSQLLPQNPSEQILSVQFSPFHPSEHAHLPSTFEHFASFRQAHSRLQFTPYFVETQASKHLKDEINDGIYSPSFIVLFDILTRSPMNPGEHRHSPVM